MLVNREATKLIIRAAAYIRVSTDEQTEFSPDAQLKAIQNYCKNNNMILDKEHIYIDEGISGRKADKRPAFQSMIKHAKKKEFDVILVHKFDRFARSREDSVVYKSLLKKECNVKVVSITESIEDDKFSVILEAMLEAMAEYYSLNLSDEVKKGMTEKALRGEWQTVAPFGYKLVNKKLEIYDEEAEAVKLAFNDLISGKTCRQIAIKLNNMGYLTKQGNKIQGRTIEYMITNPVYYGMAHWTPSHRLKRNESSKDTIIVKSQHEPIIDKETWDKAQASYLELKKINSKYSKGFGVVRLHWLNGLIRCPYCGYTFVHSNHGYYNCNGYSKGICRSQNVKISLIEDAILEQLKSDFSRPISLEKRVKIDNKSDMSIILAQLDKLPEKEKRAKEAYINGIDSLEEYKENKANIDQQRKALEKSLKECEKPKDFTPVLASKIKTVYETLIDQDIPMEEKYKLSHLLIDKIVYEKATNTLHLTYKYQMQ